MSREQLILPTGLDFPWTVGQISREFDQRIRQDRLEGYRPVSTGYGALDEVLGGGFLSGCLILLGGRQNVGKTIWVLQAARNVARGGNVGCVVCYEHSELHLFHRLLCMESYLAARSMAQRPLPGGCTPVTLADIREAVLRAVPRKGRGRTHRVEISSTQGLQALLNAHPAARLAWDNVGEYLDRLLIARGHPVKSTLNVLRIYAEWLQQQWSDRQIVLFIDYLQKVPYSLDSVGMEKERQAVLVTEGLKNLALHLGIPIVAIAAVDPQGLKRDEPQVEDLLGGSAVKYEPDVAIMMIGRWREEERRIGFVVGKNRAGPTDVEIIYRLVGRHFCFHPQAAAVRHHGQDQG
jgi:replicative DNA helicase